MKALELTVFEREPGRYGREATYNSPDGFWAYPTSHVDGYAQAKRLTDAELAAEHHAAQKACWRELAINQYADEGAHSDVGSEQWAKVVHRFATLPYYDEEL